MAINHRLAASANGIRTERINNRHQCKFSFLCKITLDISLLLHRPCKFNGYSLTKMS
jgi:hypothetical protein